jgi:hypothetical protein
MELKLETLLPMDIKTFGFQAHRGTETPQRIIAEEAFRKITGPTQKGEQQCLSVS